MNFLAEMLFPYVERNFDTKNSKKDVATSKNAIGRYFAPKMNTSFFDAEFANFPNVGTL